MNFKNLGFDFFVNIKLALNNLFIIVKITLKFKKSFMKQESKFKYGLKNVSTFLQQFRREKLSCPNYSGD